MRLEYFHREAVIAVLRMRLEALRSFPITSQEHKREIEKTEQAIAEAILFKDIEK